MSNFGINLSFCNRPTPNPSDNWVSFSEEEKLNKIRAVLSEFDREWIDKYDVSSARDNGFVVLEFKKSIPVDVRSKYLLDLESLLCNRIESCITIWIAPVGDKSSLRNLRGIEVKNV